MPMTPRVRKLALTTHVTSSVGWLGAVAAFLALAVAGLNNKPWGMTGYGQHEAGVLGLDEAATGTRIWRWLWLAVFIAAVLLFAVLHLTGGGLHGH
jgi:hypothetical protein